MKNSSGRSDIIKRNKKRVYVVPLEKINHPRADNVRFTYFLNGLKVDKEIRGVERIPYFDTDNQTLRLIRFCAYCIKSLSKGLRESKSTDVIFTQSLAFSAVGASLSVLTGKPLVCDICEGNILNHCHATHSSRLFTWISNVLLEKMVARTATVLVVPSENDRSLYADQKFKYQKKLEVIVSGIDLSKIPKVPEDISSLRMRLDLPVNKNILIYMGKREYFPNKEAAFWINDELAPVLAKTFDNLLIIICGSGEVPDSIHPIVKFTGHVPDIYEYIQVSDICIVPYKLDTGTSLKVLDAMACAKPVVTMTNVAKLFSYARDGENIVIAEDRQDFVVKLTSLLKNPFSWKRIGDNGKLLIEKHYNWEIINQQWLSIIESTINLKGDNGIDR